MLCYSTIFATVWWNSYYVVYQILLIKANSVDVSLTRKLRKPKSVKCSTKNNPFWAAYVVAYDDYQTDTKLLKRRIVNGCGFEMVRVFEMFFVTLCL